MIINYEQLKEIFGGNTHNEVIMKLIQANVKFLRGKRQAPFTTITALNHAMGLIERDMDAEAENVYHDIQFG